MLPPTSAGDPTTSLEALLEVTRQEGFDAGREAGLAEAAAGIDARRAGAVVAAAARISGAAEELTDVRAQVVDEVVDDVVGLAFELLEVLVGRELALAGSPARDAVVRALALAPDRHGLVIRVHPDCALDDDELGALAADPTVRVERDPVIDPEGCQVTVGACHIDVQLPAALERVRRCLEELRPSQASSHATAAEIEPAGSPDSGDAR